MGKSLVIVESPSKAKTINKYLGKDFVVEATVGHIKNLPKSNISIDIENGYVPTYEIIKGKEKVVKEIQSLAKKSDLVYIATDPDREGEAIAADIADEIKKYNKNIKRVLFEEITKSGVDSAMKSPKKIDEKVVESQMARRVMDRILGYKVSPFLWKSLYYGLSAGRVQSVALKLICEREEEIRNFKKKEYWSIDCMFAKLSGASKQFRSRLYKINEDIIKYNGEKPCIENIDAAHKILSDLQNNKFRVTDIQVKEVKRNPQAPFTTSMLQQAASTRLGFAPKKTMMLAQKLYEGVEIIKGEGNTGLITYMRTDSTRISPEAQKQALAYIKENYGKEYAPDKPNVYSKKAKNAQEGHEAIRPTNVDVTPDQLKKLDKGLLALYTLIWQRFMSSQMSKAIIDQKTVLIKAVNPKGEYISYTFKATGSDVKFEGFLKVYSEDKEETNTEAEDNEIIPSDLKLNDFLNAVNMHKEQHFTNPPPRFSESSLIKQLDNLGIGRPSTYASIVSTVIDRKYVDLVERRLFATELGIAVNKLLGEHFDDVINYEFTANMEEELDTIANGESTYKKVLDDFYLPFEKDLVKTEAKIKNIKASLIERTEIDCPDCGKETGAKMLKKWGRNGLFLTCEKYPKCKAAMSVDPEQQKPLEKVEGLVCDNCGGDMVLRFGRYGKFYGCSNYPKCNGIKPFTLGIKCPKCGEGEITPKVGGKRKRTFYGCSKYPNCDFITNFEPVDKVCDKCQNKILEKKRDKEENKFLQCPSCKEKYELAEAEIE